MSKKIIIGNKQKVIEELNNSIMGANAVRNTQILIDHYVNGMTYESIAEKYELSARHVKQISLNYKELVTSVMDSHAIH